MSSSFIQANSTQMQSHQLGPDVSVAGGSIKGSCTAAGTCTYLGIPYAAPPLGHLRWAPPQEPQLWQGIRDATQPRPVCLQQSHFDPNNRPQSEDCLFLNVYAPQVGCPKASCAVMFWIHGGAYSEGNGLDYNGTGFVEMARNVVVVTINYRLGVLGFAGAEVLRSRDPTGSTGNYGLQDQRLALEWVQQNIHHFGGNKDNVLIFGQSAGSTSCSIHMVNKRSWNLYHKVILESGAAPKWSAQPMASAEMIFADVASAAKCGSGEEAVRCLMAMDAEELNNISISSWSAEGGTSKYGNFGEPFGSPTVDGVELLQYPWLSFAQGEFNKEVAVLMGLNKDEGTSAAGAPLVREKGYGLSEEDFRTLVASQFGDEYAQDFVDVYKVGAEPQYTNWYWSFTHTQGDQQFTCPSRRMARQVSAVRELFVYFFVPTPRATPPYSIFGLPGVPGSEGAFHSAEIEFVWQWSRGDSTQFPNLMGDEEKTLARTMAAYWVNFAVSSDPNGVAGGVHPQLTQHWPGFASCHTCSQGKVMFLDSGSLKVADLPFGSQCDMMDKHSLVWPCVTSEASRHVCAAAGPNGAGRLA